MAKDKLCIKARKCTKTDLNKLVLAANGCPHHAQCDEFVEIGNKIKDKMVSIKVLCTIERCFRDDRRDRVVIDCLDCKNIKVSNEGKFKLDVHSRCINEYCYNGKKELDSDCLECIDCRIFNGTRWVHFRGGKDIKGRSL